MISKAGKYLTFSNNSQTCSAATLSTALLYVEANSTWLSVAVATSGTGLTVIKNLTFGFEIRRLFIKVLKSSTISSTEKFLNAYFFGSKLPEIVPGQAG